jgi:hypothetical protein
VSQYLYNPELIFFSFLKKRGVFMAKKSVRFVDVEEVCKVCNKTPCACLSGACSSKGGCSKGGCCCTVIAGTVVLGLGVIFVLRDWGVWTFWNIQPWSVVFLLAGLALLFGNCCNSCKKE